MKIRGRLRLKGHVRVSFDVYRRYNCLLPGETRLPA